MKISELQSLMAHNRTQIRKLEEDASNFKKYLKQFAEDEDTINEYYCHKQIQLFKKKIIKLVSLQKSLKREIKAKVEMESERNALNIYYTRLNALLDNAK